MSEKLNPELHRNAEEEKEDADVGEIERESR